MCNHFFKSDINSFNFTQVFNMLTEKLYNLNFLKTQQAFHTKSKTCNSRLKRCAKMLEKIHTSVNLLNKCHNCSQVFHLVTMNCICIAHCILESTFSGPFSIFLIIKRFRTSITISLGAYFRVQNECSAAIIWIFSKQQVSLLERAMHFIFKIFDLLVEDVYFTGYVYSFCKITRGYIYSRSYVYSGLQSNIFIVHNI